VRRVLVLVTELPGTGKTRLANRAVETLDLKVGLCATKEVPAWR
jgi:nucleoside-triphosphatase THEP1